MTTSYTGGQASLWIQPDGPNTKPVLLACHGVGDITEGLGDLTFFYCPDPSGMDKFKVRGAVRGAPDPITVTVTGDVTDTLDALETLSCPATIFVHKSKTGRRDVFTNYDRTFVLRNAQPTSRGLSNLAARTPDDNGRSEQTFDLSADELLRPMRLVTNRQAISEAQAITDLSFCNDQRCRTDDAPAQAACQTGYASTEAGSGVTANVLATANGATWAATAADPFAADEDISGIECFEMGQDEIRVLAARGVTDAAAPAEISYSDNGGTSWSAVNIGSTNGQFIPSRFGLFALDRNNIWVGTDDGYIYYSEDAGLTWVAQESGTINSGAWNAIRFSSDQEGWAGGEANELAKTIDGGSTWSAVAGPSAQSSDDITVVEVLDRNRVWIGYNDGTLWYTIDGGSNWYQRAFVGSGVGQVRDIVFLNDLHGYMIRNNASPVGNLLFTIDGGYTWESITTVANSGLNTLYACGPHQLFISGAVNSSTGFIAKAQV